MLSADAEYNARADALACIQAVADGDEEALRFILGACNQPAVIRRLAEVAEELLGSLALHLHQGDDEMLSMVRDNFVFLPPEDVT